MEKNEIIMAVVKNYRKELREVESRDAINKLYRHARIWSRIMCASGIIDDVDKYRINEAFKKMRWNRLNKIEEA